MITLKKNPVFRLAEEGEQDTVLALLNEVFDEQQRSLAFRDEAYWNWKFVDNPFGKSYVIVFEVDNKIVGVSNLWPWQFTCRGQIIKALQSSDAAVLQAYRGKGLFQKSRLHAVELAKYEGYHLFFNYPNVNSLPAYQSLGWEYLGVISWWVKILRPINLLKGYFAKEKATAATVDQEYSIDTTYLDELGDHYPNLDGSLKINRVEGFHQWRYVDRPNRSYGMIKYEGERKRIAAVFTINQNNSTREMVVVDIIGSSRNLISLFRQINEVARQLDVDFIAVMDNTQYQTNRLLKLGYLKKKSKNMVTLPLDIGLEEKVTSFSNWSLMAGMHDSI
jgi:GNAT superfamily N-acetyltransferase